MCTHVTGTLHPSMCWGTICSQMAQRGVALSWRATAQQLPRRCADDELSSDPCLSTVQMLSSPILKELDE